MVSIPGVTFIFASLDGRLDLSDNFDLPCSFSRFIQRYNVERAIPHRRAVFVTEPVSVYIPSHFWRIRIFRISSFMPRRYRLRFVYEKKNCSVSIDTLQNTAHRWYPDFANLLRLERLAKQIGLSAMEFAELFKGRIVNFTGRLFSSEHNRWFATDNTPLQILRDNDKRLTLTANRIPLSQWFNEQYDKLRQSIRQPIQPKKSRGMKL